MENEDEDGKQNSPEKNPILRLIELLNSSIKSEMKKEKGKWK